MLELLATVSGTSGAREKALAYGEEALTLLRGLTPADCPKASVALASSANMHAALGEHTKAAGLAREARARAAVAGNVQEVNGILGELAQEAADSSGAPTAVFQKAVKCPREGPRGGGAKAGDDEEEEDAWTQGLPEAGARRASAGGKSSKRKQKKKKQQQRGKKPTGGTEYVQGEDEREEDGKAKAKDPIGETEVRILHGHSGLVSHGS